MVGERLKKLRSFKGYTLKKLEELSGVSYVQIGRYEKGKVIPNASTVNKLAEALDVSYEDIMYGKKSEAIKDEDLDKRFNRLKEVIGENDSSRKTLMDIFDLILSQESSP